MSAPLVGGKVTGYIETVSPTGDFYRLEIHHATSMVVGYEQGLDYIGEGSGTLNITLRLQNVQISVFTEKEKVRKVNPDKDYFHNTDGRKLGVIE